MSYEADQQGISILLYSYIISYFKRVFEPFIQEAGNTAVFKLENDVLYQKIKASSKKYNEQAEDAYIDRVWKKTPGRNGRKVDVMASYKKMKKEGKYLTSLLVFEESSPEISLEDLPASPIYREVVSKNKWSV